jgi:hypothetical protein
MDFLTSQIVANICEIIIAFLLLLWRWVYGMPGIRWRSSVNK